MTDDRPFCAPATPPGVGGISVIRMSGRHATTVADRIFCVLRASDSAIDSVSEMPGYTMAFGRIIDPSDGRIIDEVVLSVFRMPHSYTGEDMVEISCHGGTAVRHEVMRVLCENGARPADPGEFTKAAFLSGKMDLTQAEAVMDIISAESAEALRVSEIHLLGALKNEIRSLSEKLYEVFAQLEMLVEFEEEDESVIRKQAEVRLLDHLNRLTALEKSYAKGKLLTERMTVVLAGVPNSGKSSLLNRLSGYDRAIVTPVAGTTRDTLEVLTSIRGVAVRLIDTAGLRNTDDEIESLGISRTYEAAKEADLVIWLVSSEDCAIAYGESSWIESHFSQFKMVADMIGDQRLAILISKSDLVDEQEAEHMLDSIVSAVRFLGLGKKIRFSGVVSAYTQEGVESIADAIKAIYDETGMSGQSELLLMNNRHFEQIRKAMDKINQSIISLQDQTPTEVACALIRLAMDDLGEMTGDSVSDTLVDTIFSRFCIGK
ncbi:MAG: tRNA uridine-5-carboxymethylaminomethyl(34) synthesis GTPase MnmE [Clostridiaceae bacterium]|nr:tRNA uridine-5-carboxymethylaminomethyl(34) synthesis GTPase MnmE [Clostridiaceae bacterium]